MHCSLAFPLRLHIPKFMAKLRVGYEKAGMDTQRLVGRGESTRGCKNGLLQDRNLYAGQHARCTGHWSRKASAAYLISNAGQDRHKRP